MAWYEDFAGKGVVVTGASSGIGRETALAFGAAKARVALVARRREVLENVAAEVRERGGEAHVLPADLTKAAQTRSVMRAARERLGVIDLVVNNAGLLIPSPVRQLKEKDLQAMLRLNLLGALFVMQEALRQMEKQPNGGTVVNVASLAGRRGISPIGGYCASKFALVGLTEALRTEIHGSNLHVALVMPGVIDTPMVENAGAATEEFLWPTALNMPPSWVVWAIFAAARFRLVEISVPPGAATLEKLASLVPGVTDSVLSWSTAAAKWFSR